MMRSCRFSSVRFVLPGILTAYSTENAADRDIYPYGLSRRAISILPLFLFQHWQISSRRTDACDVKDIQQVQDPPFFFILI
ncbi:hypothetical protein L209DRAFT_365041 [Thermothelomyces heterothallicus CBS 203.75]